MLPQYTVNNLLTNINNSTNETPNENVSKLQKIVNFFKIKKFQKKNNTSESESESESVFLNIFDEPTTSGDLQPTLTSISEHPSASTQLSPIQNTSSTLASTEPFSVSLSTSTLAVDSLAPAWLVRLIEEGKVKVERYKCDEEVMKSVRGIISKEQCKKTVPHWKSFSGTTKMCTLLGGTVVLLATAKMFLLTQSKFKILVF